MSARAAVPFPVRKGAAAAPGAPSPAPAPASPAPAPSWDGPEYARVPPGVYDAIVTKTRGPEWVRRFRRWCILIEFEFLCEPKRVCAFFNLGTDPATPHAGAQSRYFQAWVIANGARPRPRQKLDTDVFRDGQLFRIEVEDNRADAEGQQKDEALAYSRVRTVLSAFRQSP